MKEQLSSTSISSPNLSATASIKENGGNLVASQSLASPTMSDCSGSGTGINSTGMTRRQPEDSATREDENKVLESNDEQRNSVSGCPTPVSMVDKNDFVHDECEDEDNDDDDIEMTIPAAISTASTAYATSSITNSIIASTTMTTNSASVSNGINTLTKTTKSTEDNNDIHADRDDIAAKDKEVSLIFFYTHYITINVNEKVLLDADHALE